MKKKNWNILFVVFLVLFVIDLIIPDPIPIIDEAILLLLSSLIGYKAWRIK